MIVLCSRMRMLMLILCFLWIFMQQSEERARLAEAESQRLQRESARRQELEQKYRVCCLKCKDLMITVYDCIERFTHNQLYRLN